MNTQLLRQTPIVRCAECGSPDVVAYCHHCGKPMCAKHGPVKPGLYWFTENREFQGFSMSQWPLNGNQGAHCKDCAHSSLNYRRLLIYPGILIALISAIILLTRGAALVNCLTSLPPSFPQGSAIFSEAIRDPSIYQGVDPNLCYMPTLIERILATFTSLAAIALGLAMAVCGYILIQRRKKVDSTGEFGQPVHLGPATDQIKAVEVIKAAFRIDTDLQAKSEIKGPVTGTIFPFLRFSSQDIERIHEYRKKYHPSEAIDLEYCAGYLVTRFQTNQKIHFENGSGSFLTKIFPLRGSVSKQPYLSESKGSAEAWVIDKPLTYTFCLDQENLEDWNQVPVRLLPLLEEKGSSQQVRFQVQINTRFFPTLKAYQDPNGQIPLEHLIVLQKVEIRGDMEYLGKPKTNGIVKELEDKKYFSAEWQNLWTLPKEGITNIDVPPMTFKNQFQPDTRLTGSLQIRVPALVSGIAAVQYASSLGFPVKDGRNLSRDLPFTGFTLIELEFDIAMNKLPTSNPQVHLEPLGNGRMTGEKAGIFYYPGSPTPDQVQKFLIAISRGPSAAGDSYMYLRSVVQDPKRLCEDQNADNMWYWDVTGRYYEDVTPADFHLVIYGMEGGADDCRTFVELSVKSFLCEDEKKARDGLKGILKTTFDVIKAQADATLGQEA